MEFYMRHGMKLLVLGRSPGQWGGEALGWICWEGTREMRGGLHYPVHYTYS